MFMGLRIRMRPVQRMHDNNDIMMYEYERIYVYEFAVGTYGGRGIMCMIYNIYIYALYHVIFCSLWEDA